MDILNHLAGTGNTESYQSAPSFQQCPHCPYQCERTDKLKIHINSVHSDARPHPCNFCEKRFKLKDKLNMHVNTGVWKQWLMCCVTRWSSSGIFSISLRVLQLEKRSRTNGNNAAVVHRVPASHCLLLDHMLWCGGAVVCGGALLLLEIFRLWTRAATKHSDTGEHTSSGS